MNNDIKEILEEPKILMLSYGNYISIDDYVKLKDYITNLQENYEKIYNENCKLRKQHNINDISLLDENHNLQEENERLKEILHWKQIENNIFYKSRIDKAVKYIKNDWYELNTRDIEHCINLNKDIRIDLLNILQGENNDI